ncbi:DUF2892 domain-containing protein [Oceanidesulfovibrio indonesiensis]|jgi:hypothetical protein|uniref:DUF2892 domain-containing protein n=1 Tax=Oceanidesulfovibrio indonesiensis TaxID=54767 RepID=A0A7M3MAM3_9BACT|nr:DUF2892 domain-containing protein [Oceanidesulfovibrio indonesiensis]TVM14847.1 DUF2892 domain-containing protein [Oceanidesulfovibrio indonesiensis]
MLHRILRGAAGFFVLASIALALTHSMYWLILTAFVGLNLLQSAFTDWCPLKAALEKFGVRG